MYRPRKYLEPLQAIAGPPLSSTDLAALTLANGCAIAWLSLAQGATSGRLPLPLPLGCTLLLPLLAFFAGQPLRKGESTAATNPKPKPEPVLNPNRWEPVATNPNPNRNPDPDPDPAQARAPRRPSGRSSSCSRAAACSPVKMDTEP